MLEQLPCSSALLSKWLDPFISSNLMALESKQKILQCAPFLPPFLTPQILCYESPLREKKPWGNLFLKFLSSDFQELQEFSSTQESKQWRNLSLFLKRGKERQLFCKGCMQAIWLEFGMENWPPRPHVTLPIEDDQENAIEIAKEAFSCLKGKNLSLETLDFLHHFIREGFLIRCIVFAPSLDTFCVRLEIPTSSDFDLSSALKQLGHPGISRSFLRICNRIKPFLQPMTFYMEIGNQIFPRFELPIIYEKKKIDSKWWNPILRIFIEEKLIDKQKQRELLSWLGKQVEPQTNNQLTGLSFSKNELRVLVVRFIARIKLIYLPKKPLELRAYFGAFPLFSKY